MSKIETEELNLSMDLGILALFDGNTFLPVQAKSGEAKEKALE